MPSMMLNCLSCTRRFNVEENKVDGLRAVRCECGQPLMLSGKGLQRLGNYLLLRKIAAGGMGEIYFGIVSGVEGFEREVAIKKMLPHLNQDRSFVDMMIKEAKLTVLLNHPNIVQVYDLAKQNDQYYIAMEYVPGVTISAIMQQSIADGALMPVAVAVHTTVQMLRGLMYAHNLPSPSGPISIIHRDITPQNIMVTARAAIKITDFGIARAVNEISTTSPGLIKGKLGYIAPEQLLGRAPSPHVDLFCAGIVLWEMLAGRRLFKGTSEVDTFRLISEASIPDLRDLRGDVPEPLMAVIRKSLAKVPEERYADGDAFADALLEAVAPQTADGLRQAAEQYLRRQKTLFAGVYVHDANAALPAFSAEEVTHVSAVTSAFQPPPAPAPVAVTTISPPPTRRGQVYAAIGGVAAVLIGGLTAYAVRRSPSSVPQDVSVQSAVPSAAAPPPAPAAAAAPAPAPPAPRAAEPAALAPPAPAPKAAAPPSESKVPRHARGRHHKSGGDDDAARPLSGAEIQKTIAQHQSEIARCLRGLDAKTAPKQVAAKLTIEQSGSVSEVHLEPEFASEQGRCVVHVLQGLKFRQHPYEGLQVTIPLRLQVF